MRFFLIFSEPPSVSPPLVWFKDETLHHTLDPGSLTLMWDPYNLTMNRDAKVTISLWGYKEDVIQPQLLYIDDLKTNQPNDGQLLLTPREYGARDNGDELRSCEMGLIKINLTNPEQEVGMPNRLGAYALKKYDQFTKNFVFLPIVQLFGVGRCHLVGISMINGLDILDQIGFNRNVTNGLLKIGC